MLGANPDRTISLAEIASAYGISLNHLKKVSARLVEHELVLTERGRAGGLKLVRPLDEVHLGEIFRISQTDTAFVECMARDTQACVISPVCKLQSIFQDALTQFIEHMDQYTLSDLVQNKDELNEHLGIPAVNIA